jgi:hypothetical protein
MLYCNDELVNSKKPEWANITKELAKIKQMPNPVRIVSRYPIEINASGAQERIPTWHWPAKAVVLNENGESETWIYTRSTPRKDGDNLIFTERYFEIKEGSLSLDVNRDTEKIYFILNKSGLLNQGSWKLENLLKDDTDYVAKIAEDVDVKFYLTSPNSPIYNDHNKLRTLAASWGIGNSEKMYPDTLRKELYIKVMASQKNYSNTRRGTVEFVVEVNGDDPFSEYRSIIQLAVDNKIIGFNDREKSWYFLNIQTGEFAEHIVNVSPVMLLQKNQILFEYVKQNAALFTELKNLLPSNAEKLSDSTFGAEVRGRKEMREKAKALGIVQLRKSDEKIWQEIDEKEKQLV